MDVPSASQATRSHWFVGASFGGTKDQTQRFLEQGVWENGYPDKYIDLVKSMQVGDPIAIKATYVRRKDLPFDNRGHNVSVMAIKATGIVTGNAGDGRLVKVDWAPVEPTREYYMVSYRKTVWRVVPDEPWRDELINFAFHRKPQSLSRYLNDPYWRERFGDGQDALRFA